MKTMLNIKTDVDIKKEAQKTAAELGMPLGTIINVFLRQFVRDKRLDISISGRPSKYLRTAIEEAQQDLATGKAAGPFASVDSLFKHLQAR